jgi:hypothetical protein
MWGNLVASWGTRIPARANAWRDSHERDAPCMAVPLERARVSDETAT